MAVVPVRGGMALGEDAAAGGGVVTEAGGGVVWAREGLAIARASPIAKPLIRVVILVLLHGTAECRRDGTTREDSLGCKAPGGVPPGATRQALVL